MTISWQGRVLYIGGFELPDKNAAAQRVIGIGKGLREIGYEVKFVNALKEFSKAPHITTYYGFSTFEYKREGYKDYYFCAKRAISIIKKEKPTAVIAYNYPAVALNNIRKYCQANNIKCVADVTEWPRAVGGGLVYRTIKELDTFLRMRYIHKRVDSIIAISKYLYDYYKPYVSTVLIPPTVDISDEKWNLEVEKKHEIPSFVYAGSPSAVKEKLDVVVQAIEECAKTEKVLFYIVGITKEQFVNMYSWRTSLSEEFVFLGRVTHSEAIRIVKKSNWAIILRDNNRVVNAGFPTKLVEAISCGTPVIINRFSNVDDYLTDNDSIILDKSDDLAQVISEAKNSKKSVNNRIFDYHMFLEELRIIIK